MKARLVFIDESGLLMAPILKRTWSIRGKTPVLYQKTRSHKKVSMIAALTIAPKRMRLGLYFTFHPDRNIASGEIVQFLQNLRRHLQKPLVVIWDRLLAHRSKRVARFLKRNSLFNIFYLPPYAPEINPVEPFWGYLKQHNLANYAPPDTDALHAIAQYHARKICRRPQLLKSFLYKTPLFICPT